MTLDEVVGVMRKRKIRWQSHARSGGSSSGATITLQKNHLGLRPPVGVETVGSILLVEGSGRRLFGGMYPAKKHGPWVVAHVRVVTPSGDPV